MKLTVVNHCLAVGTISLIGVASSSLLQVGDTGSFALYSCFDTPPESVVAGPIAPLPDPQGEGDGSTGSVDAFDRTAP